MQTQCIRFIGYWKGLSVRRIILACTCILGTGYVAMVTESTLSLSLSVGLPSVPIGATIVPRQHTES